MATLLLDIAKGYAAVWIAGRLTGGEPLWMALAALAVMAGHAFPVFLGFKGGKAVASFIGAFLCLTPLALVCVLVVFAGVVAWSRYISLGSIMRGGDLSAGGLDCAAPAAAGLVGGGRRGGVHHLPA